MDNEKVIWDYLLKILNNEYGVAGLMGNLKSESGLNPQQVQGDFTDGDVTSKNYTKDVDSKKISKDDFIHHGPHGGGYGLAQWTSAGRKQGLYEYIVEQKKKSIGDLNSQLEYLYKELSTAYKTVFNGLKKATSVREASDLVLKKFERPKNQGEEVQVKRADTGMYYYNKYHKVAVNPTSSKNTPQRVIDIALAEVGYLEKIDGNIKYLFDKTANAGSNNYTKYGKEMHEIYPAVMDYPAYWCDCFVDWCFYKAYGVSTAKSMLCGNFDDYTVNSAQLYKNNNAYIKRGEGTPKPGDQIFFNNGTRICHTGIVIKVDGSKVYTVEGNTSGASELVDNGGGVAKKSYSLSYEKIDGYGRPKYDKSVDTIISSSTALSKTPKCTGIVRAPYQNVRKGAGTNFATLTSYPQLSYGTEVGICETVKGPDNVDWYYVRIDGPLGIKYGFMSSKYLEIK